jgi:hypothetical protein
MKVAELIIDQKKNLSVDVRIWWYTKSGKYVWVGNLCQPISEAFRVHRSKLREV